MSDVELKALMDRNEIIDLFTRYATAIDQRDRELLLSCFVDDLEVDIEGVDSPGGAQGWADMALAAVGVYEGTHHIITNHDIRIKGDRATGTAYLQAQHWNPDSQHLVGGYYQNDFQRTDRGWRISRLGLKMTWSRQD